MLAPDRCIVVNALWIMPHPIRIDEMPSVHRDDLQHVSVNVVGYPRNQMFGRRPQTLRPVPTHQIMVSPNASRSDDHRLRFEVKCSHHGPRTRHTSLNSAWLQHLTLNAINNATACGQRSNAMPKAQRHQSLPLAFTDATDKWLYDPWTRTPGDMKAWHRIAMSRSKIPTALCPLHNRKCTQSLRTQPGVFFPRRKSDIGLRP